MSYFQELDAWLTAVLLAPQDDHDEEEWFSDLKKQLKDKILESYHNGQKAGLQPKSYPREEREQPREPQKRRPWPSRARHRQ